MPLINCAQFIGLNESNGLTDVYRSVSQTCHKR